MSQSTILIVEDQHALALALAAAVSQVGAASKLAPTAAQARELLEGGASFEGMILDIGLPDGNGLEFLASLSAERRPPTIVVTAHGEIQNTIEARKLGVVEFLTKPLDFGAFQNALRRMLESSVSKGKKAVAVAEGLAFIGAAASMRTVFRQIAHSCASDDPVLVRGETGTGKSHAARLIQTNSARGGPAHVLAAGPATSIGELEAALGGAGKGVLIIEDVGQLAPDLQGVLVGRIGEEESGEFPRLVATSGDALHERVRDGSFRSDLYYRLQVLEVRLPPLRERLEDLPALVSYFIGQLMPGRVVEVSDAAWRRLSIHDWPGNLLELRNSVAYALTVNPGATVVDEWDLPPYLAGGGEGGGERMPLRLGQALDGWLDERLSVEEGPVYRELSEALEAELIRRLLKRYDGKLARLAAALKANRTTLRKRLNES
ncbi:MAG: response regulator [Verrucomicrobia bacterium]|nr:response regulator [Verrucomicrobiota bacterium]MDA1005791.1 response regulator [Verrucomicrobiota bacterium]